MPYGPTKLDKAARQQFILAEFDVAPTVRIAELAERLGVSPETIRRDLDELTGAGRLNRTYGGAVRALDREPAIAERHRLLVPERERIARRAVADLAGAKVLMLAAGSTTTHVARRIAAELRDVTVLTHSFGIATVLATNPTITTLLAPGEYHPTEGAMYGAHTVGFLASFYADVAVMGASGLTAEGPTEALIESGAVCGTMLAQAARTMVVADHSKFDRVFPALCGRWAAVERLVTDEAPPKGLGAALARAGVAVALA